MLKTTVKLDYHSGTRYAVTRTGLDALITWVWGKAEAKQGITVTRDNGDTRYYMNYIELGRDREYLASWAGY